MGEGGSRLGCRKVARGKPFTRWYCWSQHPLIQLPPCPKHKGREGEPVSFWCSLLFPHLRLIQGLFFRSFPSHHYPWSARNTPLSFKQRPGKEMARTTQLNSLASGYSLIFLVEEGSLSKTRHSAKAPCLPKTKEEKLDKSQLRKEARPSRVKPRSWK